MRGRGEYLVVYLMGGQQFTMTGDGAEKVLQMYTEHLGDTRKRGCGDSKSYAIDFDAVQAMLWTSA